MNKPYDAKSDVWALGCLVYELAMLTPPFCARDVNSLAAKVKTAPVPRVTSHYSQDLVRIIHAMLTKDPRQRPDVATILSDPAVTSRMQAVLPADDKDDAWAGETMRTQMIATIRVPAGFGLGGLGARYGAAPNGGLKLPAASYPTDKKEEANSGTGADTPRSEASGKENNVQPSSKYSHPIASAYNQQPKRPLTHVSSSVASNVPGPSVPAANNIRPSAGIAAYNRNANPSAPSISSYGNAAYPNAYGAVPSRAANPAPAAPSRYAAPAAPISSRYAVPSAPVSSRYAAPNVPISSRYAVPSSRAAPAPYSRVGAAVPSAAPYAAGVNRVPSAYDRNAAKPYVAARIGYRY